MNRRMITPGIRQLLVAASPQLAALSVGGAVGYPGVLLHQFRTDNTSIDLDLDTASWIGSLHGLAGIPSILMPAIMQWKGRKCAFAAASCILIAGWILVYTATSIVGILISECLHGLGTNSILAVSMLSMGEMLNPAYRNVSMVSFSVLQILGMAMVGILTRYVHWKTISIIMTVPIVLALIISSIWPESPSWLAYKGKFDKCERAFTLLRGTSERSRRELEELITAQKCTLSSEDNYRHRLSIFLRTVTQKDFYVPSLHMFVLLNAMYWSGVMVVIIYSSDLIERVTLSEQAAISGGIVMNLILFVCFTITALLIRRFNNKPVLLLSIFGTCLCLIASSVVMYMQSNNWLRKDSLVCLYCLLAYIVCSSLGLNSIIFTVAAELMPVKHRGLGGALYVIYTCLLHTSSLKVSPYLFNYIDIHGTFLVYTINAAICGLIIYKYVPETKGKSLQDIENYYNCK